MSFFNYLFGQNRISPTSVPDRVASKVSNKLVNTIVHNPVNDWRLAALRQYVIYPLFKLIFGPILVSIKGKKTHYKINMAVKTMQSNSVKPFRRRLRSSLNVLKSEYNPLPLMAWLTSQVFGDTAHQTIAGLASNLTNRQGFRLLTLTSDSKTSYANSSAQSSGVDALKTMKSVALSSLLLARHRMLLFTWTSRLLWAGSIAMIYPLMTILTRDGVEFAVVRLISSYDNYGWKHITDTELGFVLVTGWSLWFSSLLVAVVYAANPIFSATKKVGTFLQNSLSISPEDFERLELIATPYIVAVLVATDKVSMQRLNTLKGNWPNKFSPGASIQNPLLEGAFVIAARHQAEPHQFINADLSEFSDRKRYKDTIIARMKKRRADNNDEWIFCGEVLAPEVWEFRNNFIELKNNPHLVVIGQTRSGKTKSLLTIVYTFASAYPDTIWYFADGKDGADFENAALSLSEYPVAKIRDQSSGGLVEFANLVHLVFAEFKRRQKLYSEAEVNCSSIYEYRERVGDLPQIIFVVDEFFRFVTEISYNANKDTTDSLAGMLRVFLAQGASFGIHLFVATQRYQDTDVPTSMRTNFTAKMTHALTKKDADFNDLPTGAPLQAGQYYLTAQGHFSQYSNVSDIKSALPYIGNSDDAAMQDADHHPTKKPWNKDLEFKISDADDDNATPRQFDRTFASMMRELERLDVSRQSDDIDKGAIQFSVPEGSLKIGISSVMKDHVTSEHIQRIKKDAATLNCDAIILYILGVKPSEFKNGKPSTLIREANDHGGIKIVGQTIHDLRKDRKNVGHETHLSEDDVFTQRLMLLEILDKAPAIRQEGQRDEVRGPSGEAAGSAELLDKYLKAVQLFGSVHVDKMSDVPLFVQTRQLPFGAVGVFIVVPTKKRFEAALAIAEGVIADAGGEDGDVAVFIVGKDLPKNFKASKRISVLRHETIEDTTRRIASEKNETEKDRMMRISRHDLLQVSGLLRSDVKYGSTKYLIGKRSSLNLSGEFDQEKEIIVSMKIQCLTTGDTICFTNPLPWADYRTKMLGIPKGAKLVTEGIPAPIGTELVDLIGDANDEDYTVARVASRYQAVEGILCHKTIVFEDDADRTLLAAMRRPVE